jgi:hypothetical protein
MAKKPALGRGLGDIRAANPAPGFHPVLSSLTFEAMTRERNGATMDLNTGEMLDTTNPSKDTYVVGKEPDTKGEPIKTIPLAKTEDIFSKVPEMRRQFLEQTGGRKASAIGSWKNDDGTIDIDASGTDPSLSSALNKAKIRNEKAIFSTKKFRKSGEKYDGDIANPFYVEPPEEEK